jgi:hypothetical protein
MQNSLVFDGVMMLVVAGLDVQQRVVCADSSTVQHRHSLAWCKRITLFWMQVYDVKLIRFVAGLTVTCWSILCMVLR